MTRRRLASNAIVLLLVVYALAGIFSAAAALWQPAGTIGIATDYGATVRAVAPGSPAALAGIAGGDRLDLSATPFAARRFVSGAGTLPPIGAFIDVRIVHQGVARTIRLQAVADVMTPAERSSLLLLCAASLIFVAVGALLILVRPSSATWGFGLYCLLDLPTGALPLTLPTAGTALAATALYDVLQNLGVVGLLLFALEFPQPFVVAWREHIRRALPALFGVLALMTLYPDVANLLLATSAQTENRILQATFGALFAVAIVILIDTYRRIPLDERERMRWVLIGFVLGLLASYVGTTLLFSTLVPGKPPAWLIDLLVSLNVLLPLTVAHAVVRHRVLDIDFVIGRALIFTVLTTVLAGIFGLFDWLFGTFLEDLQVTRLLAAAIAVAFAFAFNRLEERTMRAIEAIFFRKRRAAEARLERTIHALPQARTVAVIDESLVGDVVEPFELTSAAVFRQNGGSRFVRSAASGWSAADCASVDDADVLLLSLRTENQPVDLSELAWHRSDLPRDGREPLIALPMHSHGELVGFVLYGGHPDGGMVDPAERALLERLVFAAGLAYDQVEAERLRSENLRQLATIAELQARLDELRRLQTNASE